MIRFGEDAMTEPCSLEDTALERQVADAVVCWVGRLADGSDRGTERARHLLRSYKVIWTARMLLTRESRRIALQFPDYLLPDSFFVCAALEKALELLAATKSLNEAPLVFILGDTSYGECCVDEVAAQHLMADVVVHYGNACLSPTRTLPVLYVFPCLRRHPGHQDSVLSVAQSIISRVEDIVDRSPLTERVVVLYDIEMYGCPRCIPFPLELELAISTSETKPPKPVIVAQPRFNPSLIVQPLPDSEDLDAEAAQSHIVENEPCRAQASSGGSSCPSPCSTRRTTLLRPKETDFASDETEECHTGKQDDAEELVHEAFETSVGPLSISMPVIGGNGQDVHDVSGQNFTQVEHSTAYLWLSSGKPSNGSSAQLRNAVMMLGGTSHAGFYCWNGEPDSRIESVDESRLLARRYHLIQKAKEAERIGIVAGTLGVSGNLAVIERCKRIVEQADKCWYSFIVGKPSPSKLGNFAEIDVFVLVACPQNALLDSKEFLRPIITPFELEVAMGVRDWFETPYLVDFADVLRIPLPCDAPRVEEGVETTTMSERSPWKVAVLSNEGAAGYLKTRLWFGLDPGRDSEGNPLESLPTVATMGRSGVAGGYVGEM
jgi:diphthamide biosynthesis protein 2